MTNYLIHSSHQESIWDSKNKVLYVLRQIEGQGTILRAYDIAANSIVIACDSQELALFS